MVFAVLAYNLIRVMNIVWNQAADRGDRRLRPPDLTLKVAELGSGAFLLDQDHKRHCISQGHPLRLDLVNFTMRPSLMEFRPCRVSWSKLQNHRIADLL